MNQNNNLKLKIALLSTCLVSASLNAVTGLVPEMAKAFPAIPLSAIELIATVPSLFQMVGVLGGQFTAKKLGYKGTMALGPPVLRARWDDTCIPAVFSGDPGHPLLFRHWLRPAHVLAFDPHRPFL